MNKILRRIGFIIVTLLVAILVFGLVLAFIPGHSELSNKGISSEETVAMRQNFPTAHHQLTTTDGEQLFLRRWNPDLIEPARKDIAIVIFHGITAHSGAYSQAGIALSKGGYTTFGMDYRGHGLSGGNRADYPDKERWIADLEEAVIYVRELGYQRVIVLGHSLGVAAAIYLAKAIPDEISGLILHSGAYRGKEGVRESPSLFQKLKILSSSIFRPSFQVVEYYREGMTGLDDPLFNFRYTLRFLRMLDVNELILPDHMNIPVLVCVGDKDELFAIDHVKELYDLVPGDKKEFLVLENTYHAKFPEKSWESLATWLNNNF